MFDNDNNNKGGGFPFSLADLRWQLHLESFAAVSRIFVSFSAFDFICCML